jgi:hypothetical protein
VIFQAIIFQAITAGNHRSHGAREIRPLARLQRPVEEVSGGTVRLNLGLPHQEAMNLGRENHFLETDMLHP